MEKQYIHPISNAGKMLLNYKLNLRVPRASNLLDFKLLLINSQDKQDVKELLSFEKFKKENYLEEYLKLLKILGLIYENRKFFLLTNKGNNIKYKLSGTLELTESDKDVLKEEFLQMEIVKTFLKDVFNFDATKKIYPIEECLSKEDIKKRYLLYRKVSESVADRESRVIYNWLLNLGIIESLRIIDNKNNGFNVCYHLIGKDFDFDNFSKIIKLTIFKARSKSDWIEVPKVRNLFCLHNNISKKQFNKFFIEYVNKYPSDFQLSTGSLLRKEVENEGLEINNKLYFYIKLT
ncbi:MAG: hypothetical protein OIN87_00685 [Candidatus Methanoperedens sp.]|nr:hypothetical protein [Candidatus Methanoperedens sp.]